MHGVSDDILDVMRTREVTGVFQARKALDAAADDLLVAGFDHADIDVSAPLDELERGINYQSIPPADLADMPTTPRRAFMGEDDVLGAQAVAGSVAGCIGAAAVAFFLLVGGAGPLAAGICAVLSGVVVGMIAVIRVRHRLYRERTLGLEQQSEAQGLLIWVRVRSPEKEAEAQEILLRDGGEAVHVHEIELAKRLEDIPLPAALLGDEQVGRP